jgi:penicillin-binding protein 1A
MAGKRRGERVEPRFDEDTSRVRADARAPTRGKRGSRKRGRKPRGSRSLLGRLLYWGFVVGIWGVVAVLGVVGYYAAELPSVNTWKVPERPPNVQIVAVDGTLIGNRGDTGGESMRLALLPAYIPNAVIAIEDRRFRSHFGVDPIGLVRAVTKNVFAGGVVEGGSTITQQLAKNMFLTPERSIKRKVQEVVLAVWLETQYSKDEILEMYLNRVYFGAGAYGIDAAARRYFDRDATRLTLGQAAMLAGLLPAPSYYAPNRNPEAAKRRAALVLNAMQDGGFITAKQAEEAEKAPAAVASLAMSRSENYVADWIMDVLPYHVGTVDQDIVVETTLDPVLQAAASAALNETLDAEGQKYGVSQGALVALDGTGAVRALVGGRSYAKSQFNRAVDARRQPGSAFKPFVYLTALQAGMRSDTVRVDEPKQFGNWSPKNSNNKYRGAVTLKTALSLSINTIAAELAYEVTPEAVVQTARTLGINSPLAPNPSIALGTSEVSLLELTGAYAPFANGGYSAQPYAIQRIRTTDGDVLFERQGSGVAQIVSIENVAMMNDMLRATMEAGTGTKAQIEGWPAAGKTGTSQDFRDAWFIGYTANLTAGVWVGNDSNAPTEHASGANLPAMIWAKFMTPAHKGVPMADLPGTDILPQLMAQGDPNAGWGSGGNERAENEQRMRDWILNRGSEGGQERPVPARQERGFFQRLFGR